LRYAFDIDSWIDILDAFIVGISCWSALTLEERRDWFKMKYYSIRDENWLLNQDNNRLREAITTFERLSK
jgi:hypothetical protein